MDTSAHRLREFVRGPLQGVALVLYFVLLPDVVVTKWRLASTLAHGWLLHDALIGLSIFWVIFVVLLVTYVAQLRHRVALPGNGIAWLAAVVLALLPFLMSASADAAPVHSPAGVVTTVVERHRVIPDRAHETLSLVVLALAAKRRRDLVDEVSDDEGRDALAVELGPLDPVLVARIHESIGPELGGVFLIGDEVSHVTPQLEYDPAVAVVVGTRGDQVVVAYARPGGHLRLDATWDSTRLAAEATALHHGVVRVVDNPTDAWRELARHPSDDSVVICVGPIDDELAARVVRVSTDAVPANETSRDIRVELLRPWPVVDGLVEPFVATLRRRCVEMVAYLALHRGEPVTGDRLRTRVLAHADVDASRTTLSNTATSIRRSLGRSTTQWRLAPVSSSGLYELSGVRLDVAEFHVLVAQGRQSDDPYEFFVRALALVQGEPLASVLKGFEWFRFEGHLAQLQREGEWVALALHDEALDRHDTDTAFWALRQGLLLDPESDVLREALVAVPRLRQFGGNRTGRAQDETVGSGRTVAVGWALQRFRDEVAE